MLILRTLLVLCSAAGLLRPESPIRGPSPRRMFSGIVEDMGTVDELVQDKEMALWDGTTGLGTQLTIMSRVAVEDAYVGCSIAVNGVCLTATEVDLQAAKFSVGLAPETLRRSNLGKLSRGSRVNVERALKANSRNSGHFVQGHVDCVGLIEERWPEGDSLWLKIVIPKEFISYVVPKGFIAIDGTSLTICDVDYVHSWFTIMLISHTQTAVILPQKDVGDEVNIEVDVLAKMVEQSLSSLNLRITQLERTIEDMKRTLPQAN